MSRTADLLQSVLNGVPAAVTLMEEVRDPLSGLVADFSVSVLNADRPGSYAPVCTRPRGISSRHTHDLRGSFGIIVGAAGLLNMMDSEEDKARILDMIQRNLQQVTQMMSQLLDYSRLESGQEKLEVTSFDASEVCTELGRVFEPMAAAKNLKISFQGPKSLSVRGDIVKVHRIAQNLVLNALKYTKTGEINVSWNVAKDQLQKKTGFLKCRIQDPECLLRWLPSSVLLIPAISPSVIQPLPAEKE